MYESFSTALKLDKALAGNITSIRLDHIRPNPYQPRRVFIKAALEDLCESIKQYGVIQPINVRRTSNGFYELVAGERRMRAAIMAGLTEIPAIVINITDNDSAVMALIENLQREDLSFLEEAEGYAGLISEHHMTQEELARKIGKSQSTIANKIRLLKLSPMVRKIIVDNLLTERHARALLKLHEEQLQLKVLKTICERGLNVKNTEELIEKTIEKYSSPNERIKEDSEKTSDRKYIKSVMDIRIFINTVKQAVEIMKKGGIEAKAAQFDKGSFYEFVVRVPKPVA